MASFLLYDAYLGQAISRRIMSDKSHILVVDDDTRILGLLEKFLSKNGYLVSIASSAMEAEKLLTAFTFDLMMVDVMMPEVTGIEFAKRIKEKETSVPVILLTALSEPADKIKGLQSGADDYITKPFDGKELLLRAQNLIDLYSETKKSNNNVRLGKVVYDMERKILSDFAGDDIIKLSSTEKKLLEILVSNKGAILSRERLSNLMGGLNERSIDVQIVRLRSKIEDDTKEPRYLQTIRNEGYVLYI